MKHQLSYRTLLIAFFCFLTGMTAYAQTGFVSGVIVDAEGLPLPGVNITIKGKNVGDQTDFDGNYRIKCEVGDTLVVSYIGSKTREILVTAEMFGEEQVATVVRRVSVETILDTVYQSEVRKNLPFFLLIPSIEESPKTYNGKRYLNATRIKDISVNGNKVKLTYFDSDIYFEIGASSLLGIQFVQDRNLPELQKTFAQGAPVNGLNTYFNPDTDISFSYGPKLSTLEFDGINSQFDSNGNLVPVGTGNGKASIPYDNNPFQTVIKTTNNLFFNISTDLHLYSIDYLNKSGKDSYGSERSNLDEFTLKFNNSRSYYDFEWDAQVKYVNSVENQPNINGFQNNLLFNALATPPSFQNKQGGTLQNSVPRSFNQQGFNNPNWLLNSNRNQLRNKVWIGILNNKLNLGEAVTLNSKLGYTISDNGQQFGLFKNTVGFTNGYSSDKTLAKDTFNANISVDWNPYVKGFDFDLVSSFFYSNENLSYTLSEQTGFNEATFNMAENTSIIDRSLSRAVFRWFARLDFKFLDYKAKASLINNTFTSTKQNSKWLLPTIQLKYEIANGLDSDFIEELELSTSFGYDVNHLNLFYDNQSHNGLQLSLTESLDYTANNDLFASDAVDLEEKESYEVGLDFGFRLFNKRWNLNTVYYSNVTDGSVFPVWEDNGYSLQNVARIQNSGIEWIFDTNIHDYNSDFSFTPQLIFSTYNTKVLNLLIPQDRVPIAGFSTISKNLIPGEPAGVLMGTRYERDAQNNIRIDSEGFPLVAEELGIIGNPIPDFNLGFSSTLKWKDFTLDFVLDYQKGVDVWNGTQNVLNFLGTSEQSGIEREITGFVFDGVNEFGQQNSISVDFGNPNNGLDGNRFVRYGFEGVAEDAIVDGSYFNFKSFNLSYKIQMNNDKPFFREMNFGIYGRNLFTTAKFRGASPYSNLFDHTSSQGLNFFNSPILSEVGFKINFKI